METQHFYHPLVAKTATISFLNVRGTSNLGFDATFIKPHKHKQNSFQSGCGDYYKIKHGNCQMTRSYRKVASIVANLEEYKCVKEVVMRNQSEFQQKLMIWAEYKCVSAIMTAIARNMISQHNLQEMLAIAGMTMSINFTLILGREPILTREFPPLWFKVLTATIPILPVLLNFLLIPKTTTIAYTIAASFLGQALGYMALKPYYANRTFSHRL
ncbi:unnamed protein product [Lactuca saligna]|uniref:Uncharacterized protein n=1 Tax=Lactuca saligna TaxID=75948 RepID=A0AA36ER41_LACSI|nr:unnamed protein product [Lactuca saligna]CAI9302617.1 unnamed protein product [Lactuca saligna]